MGFRSASNRREPGSKRPAAVIASLLGENSLIPAARERQILEGGANNRSVGSSTESPATVGNRMLCGGIDGVTLA